MLLNIKKLIICLLLSPVVFAQTTNNEIETSKKGRDVGSLSLGVYIPIAIGDNFVANNLDLGAGARLAVKFNIIDNIFIGPYLSFFNGKVVNPEFVGNYSTTTNVLFGGIVGFEKEIQKFIFSPNLGLGGSIYANKGAGDNFNDTAFAIWISPEISYHFAVNWSVFIAPEFRYEFLNIDVPAEFENAFKTAKYLNFGFGIRLDFLNDGE